MNISESTIWGVHGGKRGDADTLFLRKGFVALGWPKMEDLSKLPKTREAYKEAVFRAYPDKKPGAIPNNAGQLFRFVCEVKIDDLVVYPSQRDRQVHIGRFVGPYRFGPEIEAAYPNLREVVRICV